MPSPFPGMAPYLEDPAVWPGFQHRFIGEIQELLTEELDPRYFVNVERRVYVTRADDPARIRFRYIPDLLVQPRRGSAAYKGVAVADRKPIAILEREREENREYYLVIQDGSNREVVTVIELLSPSNKTRGSKGRRVYMKKREAIYDSKTNLVEIDLLRAGETSFPATAICDYRAYVSEAAKRSRGLFWPMSMWEPLVSIPIPLKPGEKTVLDLQRAFTNSYDAVRYGSKIDYDADPVPPLSPAQAKWARKLLKSRKA